MAQPHESLCLAPSDCGDGDLSDARGGSPSHVVGCRDSCHVVGCRDSRGVATTNDANKGKSDEPVGTQTPAQGPCGRTGTTTSSYCGDEHQTRVAEPPA